MVTDRERREPLATLLAQVRRLGHHVSVIPRATAPYVQRAPAPNVVLLDAGARALPPTGGSPGALQAAWEYVPIIVLIYGDEVANIRFCQHLHDFIILPSTEAEIEARAPREQVQVQGLRMNLATYEVYVENRRVELTYKEFELLKFFASYPHRVFSRIMPAAPVTRRLLRRPSPASGCRTLRR